MRGMEIYKECCRKYQDLRSNFADWIKDEWFLEFEGAQIVPCLADEGYYFRPGYDGGTAWFGYVDDGFGGIFIIRIKRKDGTKRTFKEFKEE